jgi:hypothetical protein
MIVKIGIALLALVILAAGGLAFYGSQLSPQQSVHEQAVPNDRFKD